MKYNKLIFGLGAIAVSLASCSEEAEYTPAPAVNTPPVYFSLADESTIDLEESDTYFSVKVYRQETAAKGTYTVNASLKTEDGSPIPAGLFRICEPKTDADGNPIKDAEGNIEYEDYQSGEAFDGETELKVEFPAGAGESTVRIDFGGKDNLTEMLSYIFDFKATGEDSPYYITDITYDVSYVPWVTLQENKIIDQTLWEPFGGEEMEFEVSVQEHPIKTGLFRVIAPYKNAPCGAYYQYDGTAPDYLYINATVANEVYFSDSKGNPVANYDTHIRYEEGQGFQEDYGWGWLGCMYSYYLLKEDFNNGGGIQILPYSTFSGAAGQIKPAPGLDPDRNPRIIKFSSGGLYGILSYIAEYNGMFGAPGVSWQLLVDGANPMDWTSLGDTEYTDGFIGQYYKASGLSIETYMVPLEANTENVGVYRLINPYIENTWIYGTPESKHNISFDVSDPEFVIISPQDAYTDEDGTVMIANAAGLYMSGLLSDQNRNPIQYTKEQVIEQGLVDKVENGVVVINHPVVITPNRSISWLFENNPTFEPAKIVLPGYDEQQIQASAAAPKKAPQATVTGKVYRQTKFLTAHNGWHMR
ncbi:MAG: hypothetical protein K2H14_03710 [Muribaculaceae bacterium]|nr:hypothetical protein [Muribaculaceae bacterium]